MARLVIVKDKMQKNYSYKLSEVEGDNFHNDFKPELTPKEMLRLGVFGGVYMRDCTNEFPVAWFLDARLASDKRDKSLNFFKVNASQSLAEWRRKDWIHPDDPRGWFQWYCRYYLGRRHEDDLRQIKRWRNMRRHISAIQNACLQGDWGCRPRQRQAVLHWAYDSRFM